jgi:hypothetical protein
MLPVVFVARARERLPTAHDDFIAQATDGATRRVSNYGRLAFLRLLGSNVRSFAVRKN